jgi:hypothetical protein
MLKLFKLDVKYHECLAHIVQATIYDAFVEKLKRKTESVMVATGDAPFD